MGGCGWYYEYSVDVGGAGWSLVAGCWPLVTGRRSYLTADEQGCMCMCMRSLRQNNERRERGTTPMPVKGAEDTRPDASITLVMDCMRPVAERHYAQTQQCERCIHGPVHGPASSYRPSTVDNQQSFSLSLVSLVSLSLSELAPGLGLGRPRGRSGRTKASEKPQQGAQEGTGP